MKIKFLVGERLVGKPNRKTNEFDCAEILYDDNDYVNNLWFVYYKGDKMMFWDNSYPLDYWPFHGNHSPHIGTLRSFRRYLKKAAKYLPNGTKIRLLSQYWKPETKEIYALKGTIKNNLTEEDSKRLIRKEMDEWKENFLKKEINK